MVCVCVYKSLWCVNVFTLLQSVWRRGRLIRITYALSPSIPQSLISCRARMIWLSSKLTLARTHTLIHTHTQPLLHKHAHSLFFFSGFGTGTRIGPMPWCMKDTHTMLCRYTHTHTHLHTRTHTHFLSHLHSFHTIFAFCILTSLSLSLSHSLPGGLQSQGCECVCLCLSRPHHQSVGTHLSHAFLHARCVCVCVCVYVCVCWLLSSCRLPPPISHSHTLFLSSVRGTWEGGQLCGLLHGSGQTVHRVG